MSRFPNNIPSEIEGKLVVAHQIELRAVAQLKQLGSHPLRSRGVTRLHTTYFDTKDFSLARQGVALRLRRCGRHNEVTAKWAGTVDGSVHARPELTVSLAQPPGSPFKLPDGPLRIHLTAVVAGRSLIPVLHTDIQRRRFDVLLRSTSDLLLAELALDTTMMRAPGEQKPLPAYYEIEIEQRQGTPRDIARLTRLLQKRFDLQPSATSKFARGLAAVYGHNAPQVIASTVRGGDTLGAATRKIVGSHLRRLRAHDPGARLGEAVEPLHDMRVATRRLRAAARALEEGMPQRLHAYCTAELEWLGQLLGSVRDLDVQLGRLGAYCNSVSPNESEPLEPFRQYMQTEREQRRAKMLAGLDSRRYFRLLIQLEQFAHRSPSRGSGHRPSDVPIAEVGRRAIKRAFRKLLKRGNGIGVAPKDGDLHALRIRAKRARYLLEFLAELTGKPGRRLVKHMIRLQDLLGTHHDAVVAASFIRTYIEGPGAQLPPTALLALGAFIGAQRKRADDARAELRTVWRGFARRRHLDDLRAVLRHLRKHGANGA